MGQELGWRLGVDSRLPSGLAILYPHIHCFLLLPWLLGKWQKHCGRKSCGHGPPPRWGSSASSLRRCSWPRWSRGKPPSTVAASSTGTLTTSAAVAACSASDRPLARVRSWDWAYAYTYILEELGGYRERGKDRSLGGSLRGTGGEP